MVLLAITGINASKVTGDGLLYRNPMRQSMVINGPCWCMQTKNSTLKSLGMSSSEASFLSRLAFINLHLYDLPHCLQAYKHIFTSHSSVDKEVKAMRSGSACIHGMTWVTPASLAYVAMHVRATPKSNSVDNVWALQGDATVLEKAIKL